MSDRTDTNTVSDPTRGVEARVHMSHCDQGEYVGSCKYGEDDCPALGKSAGTALGEVQCYCSEDDGVPDVGVSIGLGQGKQLWIGETLLRDGTNLGFVLHGPNDERIVAPLPDGTDWQEIADMFRHRIAPLLASLPCKSGEGAGEAFLNQLRRVNLARYEAWVEDADAGIMFDALELGGEVGELLNVVKKLEREERGWRGSRASLEDFADECADVLICLDKLARRKGVNLAAATVAKFNATSEKVDLPHRLALTPTPSEQFAESAKTSGDATQTREADLREAINHALQCTPHIRVTAGNHGQPVHVIEYDCGDPWQILRSALAEGKI